MALGTPGLAHAAAAADLLGDVMVKRQRARGRRHGPVARGLLVGHGLVGWESGSGHNAGPVNATPNEMSRLKQMSNTHRRSDSWRHPT